MLEEAIVGIEDMMYMSSEASMDGTLYLTVTFNISADIDRATGASEYAIGALLSNKNAVAIPCHAAVRVKLLDLSKHVRQYLDGDECHRYRNSDASVRLFIINSRDGSLVTHFS
jgi:hypothetical protein